MDERSEFMTADQAIKRLGVSRATFYNHARNLERFRKVGERRVLYRVSDIEAMGELQPLPRGSEGQPPVVYQRKHGRRVITEDTNQS
jgi:predicted DNA-binding transcriptional regulator AlpA